MTLSAIPGISELELNACAATVVEEPRAPARGLAPARPDPPVGGRPPGAAVDHGALPGRPRAAAARRLSQRHVRAPQPPARARQLGRLVVPVAGQPRLSDPRLLRPDEPRLLPAVPAGHLRGRAAAAAHHQPQRDLVLHRRRGAHLRRRRPGRDRPRPPPRRGLVGPRRPPAGRRSCSSSSRARSCSRWCTPRVCCCRWRPAASMRWSGGAGCWPGSWPGSARRCSRSALALVPVCLVSALLRVAPVGLVGAPGPPRLPGAAALGHRPGRVHGVPVGVDGQSAGHLHRPAPRLE